jgi:hypothetical protein
MKSITTENRIPFCPRQHLEEDFTYSAQKRSESRISRDEKMKRVNLMS